MVILTIRFFFVFSQISNQNSIERKNAMSIDSVQNTTRQAYNATVELAFDYNGQRENIESEKIVYVMIEHDYETQVLPIIYISLSVTNDLYTKIVKYKDSAKFYLNITRTNKNSIASLSKKSITGSFNYIPSTTNPNFQEDLTSGDNFLDNSYKRIMLGLVSIELTNKLRKSFKTILTKEP